MIKGLSGVAGIALLMAGCLGLCFKFQHSIGISLVLLGFGVLLTQLPFFQLARAASELPIDDEKLSRDLRKVRLRFYCIAGAVAGIVGIQLSPDGVNWWTVGFLCFSLASGLAYAIGRAVLDPAGGASNMFRVFLGGAAVLGFMVSVITLISQLSGESDMPTRWNVYSYEAVAGFFASIYAFYYAVAYQVNIDLVDMLRPLGFTLADGGPLGRDGKYDVRGMWQGVETLVNVNQSERQRGAAAGFFLEVSCAVQNWSGRRLLIHPKGYFNKPLGVPLTLPAAKAPPEWDKYGVYCDPPEAAPELLAALNKPDGPVFGTGKNFSYLLLDKGRLALGITRLGHPGLDTVKRIMTRTADSAKVIR